MTNCRTLHTFNILTSWTTLFLFILISFNSTPLIGQGLERSKTAKIDGLFEATLMTYPSELNRKEKYSLRKIGSQLSCFNPITIDFKNVRALLKLTNDKHASMSLILPDKRSYTLTSKEIKQQLLQKIIPGIQKTSLINQWIEFWKNRKILSGAEKSRFTEQASLQFSDDKTSIHQELEYFSIFLLNKQDTLAEYRYQRVYGSHLEELPKYENANCTPFDRETIFSRCDDAFRKPPLPIKYEPALKKNLTREFTIYFDHNSYTYPKDKLKPLINYLKQSDHQLTNVKISSYSSIEGDSANNIMLMKKRGAILKEIIHQLPYAIPEITLHEAENWALFEEQIESQKLPALSKTDWKRKLENGSVSDSFEHLLEKQRYAKVEFSLERPKTPQEIAKAIDKETLKLWTAFGYFFDRNSNRKREYYHLDLNDPNLVYTIRKLVGILYYAQKEGYVEQSFIGDYFESEILGSLGAEIMIYLFYQPRRFHLGIPKKDLLLSVFNSAKTRITALKDSPQNHKIFNDVQKVIFHQVENGLIGGSILEEMDYTTHASIDPYKTRFLLKKQVFIDMGILQEQEDPATEKNNFVSETEQLLKSEYYIFLKNLVLKNTLKVLPNTTVRRTDWYLPFDQHELLWYQNKYWDVHSNQRLDSEISIETNIELLNSLMKKPGNLCPYNIEHLAVDFYHKLLIYAELNSNELYAKQSINYLMDYYKRNKKFIKEKQLQLISLELYSVNRFLYYGQIGQWAEELREHTSNSHRASHL